MPTPTPKKTRLAYIITSTPRTVQPPSLAVYRFVA